MCRQRYTISDSKRKHALDNILLENDMKLQKLQKIDKIVDGMIMVNLGLVVPLEIAAQSRQCQCAQFVI